MKTRRLFALFAALLLVLVLAACAGQSAAPPDTGQHAHRLTRQKTQLDQAQQHRAVGRVVGGGELLDDGALTALQRCQQWGGDGRFGRRSGWHEGGD